MHAEILMLYGRMTYEDKNKQCRPSETVEIVGNNFHEQERCFHEYRKKNIILIHRMNYIQNFKVIWHILSIGDCRSPGESYKKNLSTPARDLLSCRADPISMTEGSHVHSLVHLQALLVVLQTSPV